MGQDNEKRDLVNHPPHYAFSKIEVIEIIERWHVAPHIANVIKYIARYDKKEKPLEDLKKSLWYLDRYIQYIKDGGSPPPAAYYVREKEYCPENVIHEWKMVKPFSDILALLFYSRWVEARNLLSTHIETLNSGE